MKNKSVKKFGNKSINNWRNYIINNSFYASNPLPVVPSDQFFSPPGLLPFPLHSLLPQPLLPFLRLPLLGLLLFLPGPLTLFLLLLCFLVRL